MEQPSRISPTSIVPTVSRQTPKTEFGDVLAQSLGTMAGVGSMILSGVTRGSPVVSAAVSGISAMASVVSASGAAVTPVGSRAPSSVAAGAPATGDFRGDAWDLLQAQSSQSQQYLALQNEMQRESREFNAISNILKVRHDSAKAAINNIR
ncbi:MAG: hypothetical protein HYZ28_15885 [Myxococcales bacterium]|nr:hypothetical protein [Myxococcales bacterium]